MRIQDLVVQDAETTSGHTSYSKNSKFAGRGRETNKHVFIRVGGGIVSKCKVVAFPIIPRERAASIPRASESFRVLRSLGAAQ